MKAKAFLVALLLALSALLLALSALLPGLALAETVLDGTVVSGESVSVLAPYGGTLSRFNVRAGDEIKVGDVIGEVQTTKVYAPCDGTVSGVFGQPGDSVEDVVTRVGAVLYIVPTGKYTITADIQKAYNLSDNKYVNIGETVYMESYDSDNCNTATGTITAVNGTAYTVQTTDGELMMEETVVIYRSADYTSTSRIGRGTVSRTAEEAVGGAGSIVYMHVADGDTVTRGQLLFETVTGTLDGLFATGNQIISDVSGIVASVNAATGTAVTKGDTLLTVYPRDKMQVQIDVDEYDLTDIAQGDQVTLTFNYDDTGDHVYTGTVAMISHVSNTTSTSDVTYPAYIDCPVDENIRLGMSVTVGLAGDTTAGAAAATETSASQTAEPAQDAEVAADE